MLAAVTEGVGVGVVAAVRLVWVAVSVAQAVFLAVVVVLETAVLLVWVGAGLVWSGGEALRTEAQEGRAGCRPARRPPVLMKE